LIVRPDNINALVGQTVELTCSTNLPQRGYVKWFHVPSGQTEHHNVTQRQYVTSRYKPKYSVSRSIEWMNLTITNVTFDDSGQYICKDPDGKADRGLMNLTVSGM